MSEQAPDPLECTLPIVAERTVQQFSPDAIYQAAARGYTDDLRDILILCDELTKEQMLEWTDDFERTALIMATQEGHTDCITMLLSRGANVDHMCTLRPGGTALHLAVFLNRPKTVIHQLLCHGSSRHLLIQSLLIESELMDPGADPFVVNDAGITPWDISLSNGHSCSVMFASFALFEGLLCIKDSNRFGPDDDDDLKSFWVRIIPRYRQYDHRRGKRLIGLRLCIHWRVHGETVCEMDLQGSVADAIVHEHDGFSYALLTCPSDNILMCDAYTMGNLRQRERAVLWLRGRTKVLDDFLSIVNNIHIYPSVTAVHTNDDSDNGERDCISPLLESSFDELSLVEDSSLSSSPLTLSLHSDENTRPHGLAGSKPLNFSKNRRIKTHVSCYEAKMLTQGSVQRQRSTDESHSCVICLDKPKTVGFVHGKSMHICVCETCADIVARSSNRCPLCREAIEHIVMKIY